MYRFLLNYKKDTEKALELALLKVEDATQADSRDASSWVWLRELGRCLILVGRKEEGCEALKRALEGCVCCFVYLRLIIAVI
jgi:hypothetical protein